MVQLGELLKSFGLIPPDHPIDHKLLLSIVDKDKDGLFTQEDFRNSNSNIRFQKNEKYRNTINNNTFQKISGDAGALGEGRRR